MEKVNVTENSFFDRFDFFAENVSSFNLEGGSRVGTSIGMISTILSAIVIMAYSGVKLITCL